MGSLCTQKMLATTPQIARATLGRATPLAHPNAPSRALYGPGVARPHPQPQKCSTCVLPTRSKASWDSFARKRCSQRQHLLDNARNSRGRATDRSPIQMRDLVRYTGPEWRTHAHNRSNAPRACSQHAETHHGIPLHSNGVCARNMRHLKTLGRATKLSSIKIHHIERHTGREWRIHTHTRTEILRMLTLDPPKRLPGPLCTQNVLTITYGTSESARISWTSGQPLAHQNSSYRALHRSWVACSCAHARKNAPHACFGHAKSVPQALCSHMVLAMAPLIARAHVFEWPTSRPSNAPCQAMYGPGVAAQVNAFLTRALGNPERMPGSLCTQKMLATRHRRQRA